MERYRFIDGDAHVFEPEDIWENYLEKKYQSQVKSLCQLQEGFRDRRDQYNQRRRIR